MCDVKAVDSEELAGAPEHEIEVTPAMIEAGREALYDFDIMEPYEEEMRKAVAAVYRAMVRIDKPARE
jgi:hypothetical protein